MFYLLLKDSSIYCWRTQKPIAEGLKQLLLKDSRTYCWRTQEHLAEGPKNLLLKDSRTHCWRTQAPNHINIKSTSKDTFFNKHIYMYTKARRVKLYKQSKVNAYHLLKGASVIEIWNLLISWHQVVSSLSEHVSASTCISDPLSHPCWNVISFSPQPSFHLLALVHS